MSYRSTDNTPPTEEQYEQLRAANVAYYTGWFTDAFDGDPENTFHSMDLIVRQNLSGDVVDNPNDTFNQMQEYETAIIRFERGSNPPSANDLYVIYKDGITNDYLLTSIRTIADTPFTGVEEGFSEREADQPTQPP